MKFESLYVDALWTKSKLTGTCKNKKCEHKEYDDMCEGCKGVHDLLVSTLTNPYTSIVMYPTALYERYFYVGPVNYFMVLAGYQALKKAIILICQPTSELMRDKEWCEGALKPRLAANEMINSFAPELNAMLDNTTSRLEYIQAMENQCLLLLAIMEECKDYNSKTLRYRIVAKYAALKAHWVTKQIMEWTWDRCERDKLKECQDEDAEWNRKYQELKGVGVTAVNTSLEHITLSGRAVDEDEETTGWVTNL